MIIKIGETVKRLRKEQDVTQEKLAEYLGISYQAISKWENGTALPDITLVPTLANFFGISTDELFSMDAQLNDEKVKKYVDEYYKLNTQGDTKGRIILMRKALEEYPRNYDFMLKLSYALISYSATEEQIKESKEKGYLEEAIKLCERILEDCTDDSTRHGAIQILCYQYPAFGQRDKAIKLAETMPSMVISRDKLLEHVFEGDEKIKQTQLNIIQEIDQAAMSLVSLSFSKEDGKDLSYEQKISHIEAANKLYETIIPDGNYLFYNCRLTINYLTLAKLWCGLGEKDKAIDKLKTAKLHAESYDTLPEKASYTSIFINRREHNKAATSKNWVGTERSALYNNMAASVFDNIRDMPEFQSLFESLSEYKIE